MPPRSRRPRVAGLRDPRRHDQADAESTEPTTTDISTGRTATLAPKSGASAAAPTRGDQLGDAPDVDRDAEDDRPVDHSSAEAAGAEAAGAEADASEQQTVTTAPTAAAPTRGDQLGDAPDVDRDPQDDRPVDQSPTAAGAAGAIMRPTPTGRSGRSGNVPRRRPAPATGAATTGTAVVDRPTAEVDATEAETTRVAAPQRGATEPGRLRRAARTAGEPLRRLAESRRGLVAVLAVVIVVCLVLAGLAFWRGTVARDTGPLSNTAVVDTAATAELVGQTRQAVEQVFSYDFTRLDDSLGAATNLGTGDFPAQYRQIFDQAIRGPATQQRLRQTATVLNIGVQRIEGDEASVMALVQFHAERASTGQSTDAPGLLSLRMQREDGVWKLAQLRPLTQGG